MEVRIVPLKDAAHGVYFQTVRAAIRSQTSSGKACKYVSSFRRIFHDLIPSGRLRIFEDEEDQGEDREVGCVHHKPV